ncbi:protein kinase domain-containing protein [Thauera sp. WH-1]|uniref:protein kinase domain-containing protein n=1 Tax=Thauera sp. WH-1 TaxID=3398230 RepID=UPI0039FC2884
MKPYDHCEFEHERQAFAQLNARLPESDDLEIYPSVYIADESRKVYHECDMLVIAKSFAAVVELKHWVGDIDIEQSHWTRHGEPVRDPHEINLPKAKVFKSLLERCLPAANVPFVQSVVVLTHEEADVRGADTAFDIIGRLDAQNGRIGDHLTFNGVDELAKYFRERVRRDLDAHRAALRPTDFQRLRKALDERFSGINRSDFADQISGYKIQREIENTSRFVSYLAEANPPHGDVVYRLRVFGAASKDAAVQARQFRSLDALARLPFHPNIRPAHRHPNERGLVVEVCQWSDVQTLDQVMASATALTPTFAARTVRDVARALAHVHESEASLIHRNVTPRSIIVGRDHHVELTDFDLAYDPDSQYTVMVGDEPARGQRYFAPEALVGTPDYASDLYSLGQILSELLGMSGAKDGEAGDADLRSLVSEMTQADPKGRPTAQQVVGRLSAFLKDESSVSLRGVSAPLPKQPEIGDSYDTWTLVEQLGQGATSRVFLGENLGDRATLKIFNPEVPRERCLAERDFLRMAHSSFVVRYRSFMQWGGAYWCIIQEYVQGESLRHLIEKGARPTAGLVIDVTAQMLRALDALHSPPVDTEGEPMQGPVIHNDVTPANIVLDVERGIAKLIDFGLACPSGLTVLGGTPGYVAADLQTKDGSLAIAVGDLYALAVSMVEWATGTRPSSQEAARRLLTEVYAETGERLANVLGRAIGPREQRFESAAAMCDALQSPVPSAVEVPPSPTQASLRTVEAPSKALKQTPLTFVSSRPSAAGAEAFVDYLNTIHNLSADNRHALAEAQSVSPFFANLHVEMKLTRSIEDALSQEAPAVVMLTGHAGDGKSTVAIELLKSARGLPRGAALNAPPKDVELEEYFGRPLSIVKDMSELAADERMRRLEEAMAGGGSALIVSNTGPLLSTFRQYFSRQHSAQEIEQEVLGRLDQPMQGDRLTSDNCFAMNDGKKVFIANLTMLGNVDTAVQLLDKLVSHPAWQGCDACAATTTCPIRKNVELVRSSQIVTRERVRFVYERLAAYGRRMTMRQLAAHLSFSLTGGLSCETAKVAPEKELIFSETFFGHVGATSEQAADALFCLKQMVDLHFGAATGLEFDRLIHEGKLAEAVELPEAAAKAMVRWQVEARTEQGGEARARLRRLLYMFGQTRSATKNFEKTMIDEFLQSPMLRSLHTWLKQGTAGGGLEKQKFIQKTVGVLIEEYTGCMVPEQARDRLFITLRRPDERILQSVQIVLKTVPISDLDLIVDTVRRVPAVVYKPTGVRLSLTLPLLDYIISRSRGELTGELDAIHRASLEQFRGALLAEHSLDDEVVTVLELDAQGELHTHRFCPLDDGRRLVYQK